MRSHSLALAAAALAAAGVHAQVAAGGVSVWNDPTRLHRGPAPSDPLRPEGYAGSRADRCDAERRLAAADAKRARRAARNLRHAGVLPDPGGAA